MAIKLPNKFTQVVSRVNSLRGYIVKEGYFDRRDCTISNGLRELHTYLGLTDNDIMCDGFCIINFKGMGLKNVLLEDKGSSGDRQLNTAHIQLLATGKRIYEKYSLKPDFAIITELKLRGFFEALPFKSTQLKFIQAISSKKPFDLEYANIFKCPILVGRS